jgi:hypothetical protein
MAPVVRLTEIADSGRALAEAEGIFWESAGTKTFPDEAARAAFHDLWFGRYARHAPNEFLLALSPDLAVQGYLAGAPVSDAPPLPGPDYYPLFPPELIARFPAHIHVNIREGLSGGGIGGDLVRAFAGHCCARGIPGFHAVTASESRSAAFFERCGLSPRATANWRGRDLAFLGLAL